MTILIAAGVLLLGVLLAFAARVLVSRLLGRLLPASERSAQQRRSAARGVFAFMLVVAVGAAVSVLAPSLFSDLPARVVAFLPKVAVALALLWLGAVLANLVEQLVTASLERIGLASAAPAAKIAYWLILGLALILAADQIGVETAAVQQLLLVVLVIAGAATALAVGTGGKALAGTVLAGRYVEDRFSEGDDIVVEEHRGRIVDIGLASVALQTEEGDTVEIPHLWLLERPVRRLAGSPRADGSSDG